MSMTLLQRVEIGSAGAATIDFTSIPQTYTDLKLVISARANGGSYPGEISWNMGISFNGSTTGFSTKHLNGNGSSATTSSPVRLAGYMGGASATSNTFGNATIDIPNYTSNTYKIFSSDSVSENNATTTYSNMVAGLWSNTAAITSISLDTEYGVGGNWIQGSTASLYGINRQSAIGKPKAVGGNITFANGYWVHTFTGSGTFAALSELSCDILVVAGGGAGGGSNNGGGGGAGGFRTLKTIIEAGSHPVIVGSGGPAGYNKGVDSSFKSITSSGGGYGGGRPSVSGALSAVAGGSGGGAGLQGSAASGNIGAYSPVEGYAGGASGAFSGQYRAGGGGGSGAVGIAGDSGGNGGIGSTWVGQYYAAGGGGAANSGTAAAGGIGGGGSGALPGSPAGAGTANTGSGGGGGQDTPSNSGGSGGSGVVIIRYPAD